MENTLKIGGVVEIRGELYNYTDGMSYREFCEKNPSLETSTAWDETMDEAMDAYHDCKEYVQKAMRQ